MCIGSGKTTLLNAIAGRFDENAFDITGDIKIESISPCSKGEHGNDQDITGRVGFVTQNDYLLPFLTVRETLMFAALLRLNNNATNDHKSHEKLPQTSSSTTTTSSSSRERCEAVVQRVILDLGLKECAESLVGEDGDITGKRGISGGEKRRVSVGVQLITDPQVYCPFYMCIYTILIALLIILTK
jgi:ABC-type multidrug transport system ATPase subunit